MSDSPPPQPAQLYRLPPRSRSATLAHGSDCVVALRALGEDTRVRIIGLLIQVPRDVSGIAESVGASHYNVSKHLRILREAGLLQVEKTGRRHLYALVEGIGRQAAESGVLDLGCCSFKFERPPQRRAAAVRTRRAR